MSTPAPEPMLATPSKQPPAEAIEALMAAGPWLFEIKFDGIRALIRRDRDSKVTITNRRRLFITGRYPDLVEQIEAMDFVGTLDGEIIVTGPDGRPDFALAHRRDAQSTPSRIRRMAVQIPATFVPFDILDDGGLDVRDLPYSERRERLEAVWGPGVSLASQDGRTMWSFVQEQALEGLVAKLATSRYVGRRHPSWVKLKATRRISVLVGGLAPDRDALEMYLWDAANGSLVSVGKVGSGISEAEWRLVKDRLATGQPTVVEVQYLDAAGGQLRQPVFIGIRQDVSPEDCTVETLR